MSRTSGQPRLDGLDGQRRSGELPGRALPGRDLHDLRPGREPRPVPPTTTPASRRQPPTATASAPLTRPAISAAIRRSRTRRRRIRRRRRHPTGLSATAVSASQINLSWTGSTDNVAVANYRVERCQGATCTTFAQIGAPTGTTYNDTGLTTATTYRYRVRAADAAGNLSGYTAIQNAATTDTQPPTDPTGLSATAVSGRQINLAWTGSTDNVAVANYRVERCQGADLHDLRPGGEPRPAPPTTTPDSRRRPPTATASAPLTRPATSAATPRSRTPRHRTPPAWRPPTRSTRGWARAWRIRPGMGTTARVGSASWITTGKFGNALSFNGSSARVTVGDAPSLDLTTGMTLEAWVFPTAAERLAGCCLQGPRRHLLPGAPRRGLARGRRHLRRLRFDANSPLPLSVWSHLAADLRRRDPTSLCERCGGREPAGAHADRHLDRRADDRRRRVPRAALRRPDRRGAHLQHRAERDPDPDGHEHADRRLRPARHDPADRPDGLDRDRRVAESGQPRLDGLDGQRRSGELSGRALPGRGLFELRPGRDSDWHDLQRHRAQRGDDLPLPRPCG